MEQQKLTTDPEFESQIPSLPEDKPNQNPPSTGVQNEHRHRPEKTCERLGREYHVSASSVRRAALFARGVDLAEELCPGIRKRVLSGDLKVPSSLFEQLAKAAPEEYDAILERIINPRPRAKPTAKLRSCQGKKNSLDGPILTQHPGEGESSSKKTISAYRQLIISAAAMQECWERIFRQTPTLLTDPEQQKVIQSILEQHLTYLTSLCIGSCNTMDEE